ncbi:putativetranscriptional regulator [Patulibacter medicamentivorans]|uniref:Putativetranscriptional regulator n=1 Tax=Patulibacter medicamentivorans TaxID=1097667 RepID=H0E3X5_9ACTN|nr:helix-turn-helix domain-containing protein [Patulibacter medicamentivorans]EHN11623.1 putativetranscriptional regulator [Patulibacter medicamentivorans]
MDDPGLDAIAALGGLADPVRRRLYEAVAGSPTPIGRGEAADAAGITRTLAAYHLDRLAKDGLLVVSYARRSGRSGPGAGRPAKLYARAEAEFAATAPPRDYGLAALLLAEAAAGDATGTTGRALRAAAEQLGRELADADPAPATVEDALRSRGYEPYDDDGTLRLRNCPFHAAAQRHPDVVCAMNLALLDGLASGLACPAQPQLDPGPDRCCVAIPAADRTLRRGSRR